MVVVLEDGNQQNSRDGENEEGKGEWVDMWCFYVCVVFCVFVSPHNLQNTNSIPAQGDATWCP